MPTFRHTVDIAATPDEVWQVLGDLMSVKRWIPGVTGVTRTATGRVCSFADGHTQDERILDYDPARRSYRYVIEGAPLPVRDNTGGFEVEAAGAGSRVVWQSSFAALDPGMDAELARMWGPHLPAVLDNLKRLVEGGGDAGG